MDRPCSLAILCGGRSSRLGHDKGLYAPLGDERMVERALRLWGPITDDILVIVKDHEQAELYKQALSSQDCRIVVDSDVKGNHHDAALCGIITALQLSKYNRCIAIAVDQLGVRRHFLKSLIETKSLSPKVFGAKNEGLYPLPALFGKVHLEKLCGFRDAGCFSLQTILRELGAQVSEHSWHRDLNINGNTSQDYDDYFGSPLKDRFGRRLHYLRFSLTEACNMSCSYCLPEGFPEWYRHKASLNLEHIQNVLKGFRYLGFRKVRFTGGEPSAHPKLRQALQFARELGYEDIAITTNGTLLESIESLTDLGLTSLNISLDSLRAERFQLMTKSTKHAKVMTLIEQALDLGIDLKINVVLMRTKNADEVPEFINWIKDKALSLRFIELMPTGLNQDFAQAERVLNSELIPAIEALGFRPAQSIKKEKVNILGPASIYEAPHSKGTIGFISPLSCNFCDLCNRLRVTAKGGLKLCLFGDHDTPLVMDDPLRLAQQLRAIIGQKEDRHHLESGKMGNVETFRNIGG